MLLPDRDWIAQRLPQQGAMCLLDQVLQWDDVRIVCRSSSHRDAANPLRAHGRLGAACGIEYAAQAMAVHGALCAGPHDRPQRGFLLAVREVQFGVAALDGIVADLCITAERVQADAALAQYRFSISADAQVLLSGQATVVFDASNLAPGMQPA